MFANDRELPFQGHAATFLVDVHHHGVLEQSEITDTEHFIAEDHLLAFLKATPADTLQKLEDAYGTDLWEEVFDALRKELDLIVPKTAGSTARAPAGSLTCVQAVDGVAEAVLDGVLAFGLEDFGPVQLADVETV